MKYKIVKRGEPGVAGGGTLRYYASPVYADSIDQEEISKKLSDGAAITESDIAAVIIRVVNMVTDQLQEGKIVHLGKLGIFRISLSSEGEETASDVTTDSIKSTRVLFRPSVAFSKKLRDLKFEKAKDIIVTPIEEEEDPAMEIAA